MAIIANKYKVYIARKSRALYKRSYMQPKNNDKHDDATRFFTKVYIYIHMYS